MTLTRLGVLLATLAGLTAAAWAFGAAGLHDVLRVAGRLGLGGFALLCGWSMLQFGALGAAWLAAAPGQGWGRLPLFTWARVVREAVSDLLPLSQLGGIVVSGRTVTQGGVPVPVAYGALLADMVTEMASQLALTIFGLVLMISVLAGAAELRGLVAGGVGVMVALMAGFTFAQARGLGVVGRFAGRLLPGSVEAVGAVEAARARIFADPARMGAAFGWNLLAWLLTVAGSWIVLRLMGAPLSFGRTLSLEVLIFTLRSVAFAVPGAIGFQEAAYTLAGPLLGLPAEAALALSLAKRARDVVIGAPSLLIWQAGEARALARGPRATNRSASTTDAAESRKPGRVKPQP